MPFNQVFYNLYYFEPSAFLDAQDFAPSFLQQAFPSLFPAQALPSTFTPFASFSILAEATLVKDFFSASN